MVAEINTSKKGGITLRFPKKIKLQNGLTATLYRMSDKRVVAGLTACLKLDPHMKMLVKDAYIAQAKIGKHVINVVYITDKPKLLLTLLQQDLKVALRSAVFFTYNNQAYKHILTFNTTQHTIMATTDPNAENLIGSILYKVVPPVNVLLSREA